MKTKYYRYLCIALTFFAVCMAWIFFRAESFAASSSIFLSLFNWTTADLLIWDKTLFAYLGIGSIIAFTQPNLVEISSGEKYQSLVKKPMIVALGVSLMFIICLLKILWGARSEFIYYQF